MVAWYVLTGKWRHFIIMNLDERNLTKMLMGERDYDVDIRYHGLQKYNFAQLIKECSEFWTEEDMKRLRDKFVEEVESKSKVNNE